MILASNQISLANGQQRISFKLTTVPSTALISWKVDKKDFSKTVTVSYDSSVDEYFLQDFIPSESFKVKLDTEPKVMSYEAEWGDQPPKEYAELEWTRSSGVILRVPYCDLSSLVVNFRTATEVPMESWNANNKKTWELSSITVRSSYGQPTLIANIKIPENTYLKQADGVNWIQVRDLKTFIVELGNHSRVTTDRIVNATICREELYKKQWRRLIQL